MDENPYEAPQTKLVDPPRSRRRMANLIDRALLVVLAVLLFFGILDVLSVLIFFGFVIVVASVWLIVYIFRKR
jgi:membrane protein YdbS with pleckstrin-like domain